MIKEKIIEILNLESKCKEYNKIAIEAQINLIGTKRAINDAKAQLGRVIAPLNKNIITEYNGKIYSIFYNRNYSTASIVTCISDKEADIELSLNKLNSNIFTER
jgi:hypothetical protein